MTPDPYVPPESEVANSSPQWPKAPKTVSHACRLVLASLLLGLVTLLPGIRPPRPDDADVPLAFTLGAVALFGGLTVWLVIEVWRGKLWARWGMLAYLGLGWLLGGGEVTDDFLRSPLLGTIDAVCIAMEGVACALLFFGAGAKWFATLAALRRGRK